MSQRDGNNNNYPPMPNGGQFAPNPYQPVGYPNQQGMPPQGGYMPNGAYPQMMPMGGYGAPNQPIMPQGGYAPNTPYPSMMQNNNQPAPNRYPPRQPMPNAGQPGRNAPGGRPNPNNAPAPQPPAPPRPVGLSIGDPTTTGFDDRPADADKFSIQGYITGLNKFIKACSTPMTLSIQGSWGTGKTSIMQFIKKPLDEDAKIKTVWFNTWQYSQFNMDNLLAVSLLSGIVESLDLKNDSSKANFRKVVSTLGRVAGKMALIGIEAFAGSQAADMVGAAEKKLSEKEAAENYDPTRAIRELRNEFAGCVKKACEEAHLDKIVIFVDDLDRLEPRKAVELLEVLKLFMDCEKCVFVLAIDYEVVCRGVAAKYGKLAENENDALEKGRSFFDKIIQVPFKVPVANYNIGDYISDLFKQIGISGLGEDGAWYENVIKNSIGTNPRTIKRLFNSFQLLKYIEDATGSDSTYKMDWKDKKSVKMLFASLCLQHSGENIYNYIVINANNYVRFTSANKRNESDASKKNILELFDEEKTYEEISLRDPEFGDTVDEDEYSSNLKVLTMLKETVMGGADNFDDFVGTLTLTGITSTNSSGSGTAVTGGISRSGHNVGAAKDLNLDHNTVDQLNAVLKSIDSSLNNSAKTKFANLAKGGICVMFDLSQNIMIRVYEKKPSGFYIYIYADEQVLKPEMYEEELKKFRESSYYLYNIGRLRLGVDNGDADAASRLEAFLKKFKKKIDDVNKEASKK